jgi:hypothetical protein
MCARAKVVCMFSYITDIDTVDLTARNTVEVLPLQLTTFVCRFWGWREARERERETRGCEPLDMHAAIHQAILGDVVKSPWRRGLVAFDPAVQPLSPFLFRGREMRKPLRYRGSSLIRNTPPVGPYSSPMPRELWRSWGSGCFS